MRRGTPEGAGFAGRPADARHRPSGTVPDGVPIVLEATLASQLAEIADGRVLVFDYLVTSPSSTLAAAALSARLERFRPRGSIVIATIDGVECVAEPALGAVLRAAGVRLRPVAGGVLGQFEVDLERPLPWLDFIASVAARRP